MAETNARELYLRPITPQQLLARLPEEELAVKVSREDLEVREHDMFGKVAQTTVLCVILHHNHRCCVICLPGFVTVARPLARPLRDIVSLDGERSNV